MRFINLKTVALAGAAAALVAVGSAGTSVAGNLVGSADIKDGSVHGVDLSKGLNAKLKKTPAPGKDGKDGLAGAFYATAFYNAGDTNAGAIATVACDAPSSAFTAIAGGVQVTGLDAGANARNTPVSSSFPGRMDWDTNTPKANRLDGWIVQFGGNAGATSDKAPEKVKVWALCVPNTSIPVRQTFSQVG